MAPKRRLLFTIEATKTNLVVPFFEIYEDEPVKADPMSATYPNFTNFWLRPGLKRAFLTGGWYDGALSPEAVNTRSKPVSAAYMVKIRRALAKAISCTPIIQNSSVDPGWFEEPLFLQYYHTASTCRVEMTDFNTDLGSTVEFDNRLRRYSTCDGSYAPFLQLTGKLPNM
ncbi:hypothetical protein FGIG_01442 [Fasciola gigantica]|uniref:Uncharacterized protein n=1 Tax=Fasciola gigantica TaxID=46835 RepID=A0A504YJA3_FASGI|nr:hypothetical protein FGIG_01442 [Fasciola gigantica]